MVTSWPLARAASASTAAARPTPCPPSPASRIAIRHIWFVPSFISLPSKRARKPGAQGGPWGLMKHAGLQEIAYRPAIGWPNGRAGREVGLDVLVDQALAEEHVRAMSEGVLADEVLRTVGHHVQERESVVVQGLVEQVLERVGPESLASRDKGRPRRDGELGSVEGWLGIAVGGRRAVGVQDRGRRELASGHPVGLVVERDAGQADVAPGSMQEVIPADREAVSVSSHDDDGELGSGELDACREGQCSTMGRMEGAAVDVADDPAGAP